MLKYPLSRSIADGGGRFPVGDRAAFKDQPIYGAARVSKLPERTRLPYSWFADKGDHLAVTGSGSLQRLAQRLELNGASHKTSKPARGCGLQP